MKTAIRKYIETLDDNEKILIIDGRNQYEEDGVIGDEPIRVHTERFMKEINVPDHYAAMWMVMMGAECDRYFAERYFEIQVRLLRDSVCAGRGDAA